ncbi:MULTISPECIES: bifunctional 2-polyprenyl-6-hydroxyphenol methylase/3-demethylubiquinol 3-O-methyltransferase UbiG [unclassified Microcoleus]|uniref:class I SAM-dependent methyltransferase n=1 Tax=unclassified Microcoleus TaxID=2642155 RepID=UPI0025CD06E8|nr:MULTISPECIES: class I SAM-dependent methyltransferase [unclassified Microcoleus]
MTKNPTSAASSPELPVSNSPETSPPLTDSHSLKLILKERLKKNIGIKGEFYLPCLPSMLDDYLKLLSDFLKVLGQNLDAAQTENLRTLIANALTEGFKNSPHANLIVSYFPANPQTGLGGGITLNTKIQVESMAQKYHTWPDIRPEPLFGSHPDAKVMAIVAELGEAGKAAILDVGAGPGRNSLPLARLGHSVDAIELTPIFAEKLSAAALAENLPIHVTQGDVLDPLLRMKTYRYKLAIATEVLSHFRYPEQIRLFLGKMSDAVLTGGFILFSTFLAVDGYEPDEMAKQMSELCWSYLITRQELEAAIEGLPLEIIADESVMEYEQKHLPDSAWPPTPWFVSWASGRDLFPVQETPPIELRWILVKRL